MLLLSLNFKNTNKNDKELLKISYSLNYFPEKTHEKKLLINIKLLMLK